MQGLESYINDLPSKDEVDALKYKLTDKSEKLDRLQSRLGEFELGGAALNKRNFILEENCKQLDLEVRLRSYILSAHAAKEWSGKYWENNRHRGYNGKKANTTPSQGQARGYGHITSFACRPHGANTSNLNNSLMPQ